MIFSKGLREFQIWKRLQGLQDHGFYYFVQEKQIMLSFYVKKSCQPSPKVL